MQQLRGQKTITSRALFTRVCDFPISFVAPCFQCEIDAPVMINASLSDNETRLAISDLLTVHVYCMQRLPRSIAPDCANPKRPGK